MSLIPLGDRVLIKQDEAEQTTASGLFLASESKEKPQSGIVIAAGEGRYRGHRLFVDGDAPAERRKRRGDGGNQKSIRQQLHAVSWSA